MPITDEQALVAYKAVTGVDAWPDDVTDADLAPFVGMSAKMVYDLDELRQAANAYKTILLIMHRDDDWGGDTLQKISELVQSVGLRVDCGYCGRRVEISHECKHQRFSAVQDLLARLVEDAAASKYDDGDLDHFTIRWTQQIMDALKEEED